MVKKKKKKKKKQNKTKQKKKQYSTDRYKMMDLKLWNSGVGMT